MKYVHPGPLVQKCVTMAKHAIKPLNFDPQNLYFSIFRLVLSNDRVLSFGRNISVLYYIIEALVKETTMCARRG